MAREICRTSCARIVLQLRRTDAWPSRSKNRSPARSDFLLALLCDDGHARAAHDHWGWDFRCADLHGLARPLYAGVAHTGLDRRAILALRRHCVDLFIPVALLD